MGLVYFFLVIGLLGSATVYGIIIFLLSCLIVACQSPSNPLDFLDNNTFNHFSKINTTQKQTMTSSVISQDTKHNVLNETENLKISSLNNQSPINPIITPPIITPEENINNLQKILSHNTIEKIVPIEWQDIYDNYKSLPPLRQQQIDAVYQQKSYMPLWISHDGHFNQNAIKTRHLLNEEIYLTTPISHDFLPEKQKLEHKDPSTDLILQKDLEFTINLLRALEKIRNGTTNIKTNVGVSESNGYKPFDFKNTLHNFISGNIASEITNLTNFHDQYSLLKQQVQFLNDLKNKGGYARVTFEKILKLGMTSQTIPAIRKRLMQSGFMTSKLNSAYYDDELKKQIMAFQISRGIKPDGVIGYEVYQALNQSITETLKIILINIERIRRTPNVISNNMQVRVNVPEMGLRVTKANQDLLSMKTIVGRKERKTPIFNDFIEYVDFNPYWNVPYSLATKDILPKLKMNPSYLKQQNIKLFKGNTLINSHNINWKNYSETYFPFTLRQEPSTLNALGRVKFMFPNAHAVYLHDTPAKGIFYQYIRSESSGCIRVSKPEELATLLLKDVISEIKINQIFALNKNKAVYIPHPIPVSIEYLTSFVQDGILNIRPDIYNYNAPLLNALVTAFK